MHSALYALPSDSGDKLGFKRPLNTADKGNYGWWVAAISDLNDGGNYPSGKSQRPSSDKLHNIVEPLSHYSEPGQAPYTVKTKASPKAPHEYPKILKYAESVQNITYFENVIECKTLLFIKMQNIIIHQNKHSPGLHCRTS